MSKQSPGLSSASSVSWLDHRYLPALPTYLVGLLRALYRVVHPPPLHWPYIIVIVQSFFAGVDEELLAHYSVLYRTHKVYNHVRSFFSWLLPLSHDLSMFPIL